MYNKVKEVIEIPVDKYVELIAASHELAAIRSAGVDENDWVIDSCNEYINDYCNDNPEIINYYRESSSETDQEIIDDLWFEELADFELNYYHDTKEIVLYYDSREEI